MPISEIKISSCLLHFGGYGSLDLGEIWQLRSWKGFSFEFWQCTFALSRTKDPWEKHTLAHRHFRTAPLLLFTTRAPIRRLRNARSRRDLAIPPLERLQIRLLPRHVCTFAYERSLGKAHPCVFAHLASTFAVIYQKSPHLAPWRRIPRSRRDLPISPLERLQLRVLAACTFAVSDRNDPWEKTHPCDSVFSAIYSQSGHLVG